MQDVIETIEAFCNREEQEICQVGKRLGRFIEESKLKIKDHEFWNSWMFFSDLPLDLRAQLNDADLVISKGDANYRRFVQDTRWPVDVKFEDIATFLPKQLLCIRTLKSDPIVGLESVEIAENLDAQDSRWRVNGTKGIIHFTVHKNI
jgi:hypothetical protein